MDIELSMLESLLRNGEVKSYLSSYPREDWTRCIAATLILGIRWVRKTAASTGDVDDLERLVERVEEGETMSALKQKMMTLKRELETMSQDLSGFEGRGSVGKTDYENRPRKFSTRFVSKRDKTDSPSKNPTKRQINIPQVKSSLPLSKPEETELLSSSRPLFSLDLTTVLEPRTNPSMVSQVAYQASGRSHTESEETEEGFIFLADGFLESPLVRKFL